MGFVSSYPTTQLAYREKLVASNCSVSEHITTLASRRQEDFLKRIGTIEYMSYGILNSEALALVTMCELMNITHYIESGTANGYSTEVVALNLPSSVKIITIDLDTKYHLATKTSSRLRQYPNVQCLKGNSEIIIPRLLESLGSESRVAVFVDGPKGSEGLQLLKTALQFDAVVLGALHDMAPYWESDVYGAVRSWNLHLFDTCEPLWRKHFQNIDGANGADKILVKSAGFSVHGFGLAFAMRANQALVDRSDLLRCP